MKNLPEARVARLAECHKKQKAGYSQHASPVQPYTANIVNVLIQMKADNKSDYTIHFTNKALTYLSKHTCLAEPEAVKMFVSTLKVSRACALSNA